jgi:hypothetical protein
VQAVESAQAEVALMLRLSPGGAAWRVGEARRLVEQFPATFATLHAGAITLAKAPVIAEGRADLDATVVVVVEQKVLPRAPGQTNGQLRAAVRRAVLRVDGEAVVRRRERKRRERGVVPYPERDGMASLSATLPAAEAAGTFAVLDQHARGCGSDDERSMAARHPARNQQRTRRTRRLRADPDRAGPGAGGRPAERVATTRHRPRQAAPSRTTAPPTTDHHHTWPNTSSPGTSTANTPAAGHPHTCATSTTTR